MSELNPQVGKELAVIASSPAMVVTFYIFHKNYHGMNREKFAQVYTKMGNSDMAGRQLATLFQFEHLAVRDASCLASALGVLDMAERVRAKPAIPRRDKE
jgi:hypothetical protein